MRTSAWAVTLAVVASGCTGNTISLDTMPASDSGDSGDGDGTQSNTSSDSATGDDGPLPECEQDWECGDCGSCNAGVCEEWVGCCAATPDEPGVWRCSPPWECYEDADCGVGMVCDSGICEPGPGTEVVEPPACRGDLALLVQQLPLAAPLSHVAIPAEGSARAIDGDLEAVVLDLELGAGPPEGPLEGDVARDFLGAGAFTAMAITERSSQDGSIEHAVSTAFYQGDASSSETGAWMTGPRLAATWASAHAELWVAAESRVDRWVPFTGDPVGSLDLGMPARALAELVPSDGGAPLLAASLDDATIRVLDAMTGAVTAMSGVLVGQPIDLVSHHDGLVAASLVPGPDTVALHRVHLDGTLVAAPPFGAPGLPLELAVLDLDGNGVDDVVVGNADGRLDLYLMTAAGPLCRTFLPLAPILDLEAGDVDGDGVRDLLVLDEGPTVTAIHGVAP